MSDRLGFIGLGTMGEAMAANLLTAGFTLAVHDIRPEATVRLCERGAMRARDLADLAGRSAVVFTSLPGPKEIEEVALRPGGLLATLRPGSLWIDASTNDPALARRLADEMRGQGCDFVDAPVTGGVTAARMASLTFMAGGAPAAIERAAPLLQVLGADLGHAGPAGAGCAMKLIVNLLGLANTVLAVEALTLGRAAGLTTDVMLRALSGSWGDNGMLRDVVETAGGSRFWEFALDLAKKDMALARRLADAQGCPSRHAELTGRILNEASSPAPAGDDLWRVGERYQAATGVAIAEP